MPLQPLIVPFGTLLKPEYRKNLVGHWKMNVGGLIIPDLSGNRNHGTRTNYNWNAASGWQGQGDAFDGVNDWVSVTSSESLHPRNAITVEVWVNNAMTSVDAYPTLISTGATSLNIRRLDGWPHFWVSAGGVSEYSYFYCGLPMGTWVHLVATYDSSISRMKLYCNGVLSRQYTHPKGGLMDVSSGNVIFGKGSAYFNGLIDDVRIYNRALSAGEVMHSFAQQEDEWDLLGLDDDIDVTQGVPIELLQSGNLMGVR
jgi:hypothetical protein